MISVPTFFTFSLSFLDFLRLNDLFVFANQLNEINAFWQVAHKVLFAFGGFKCFYFFTQDIEYVQLANGICLVLNGHKFGGWIWVDRQFGPGRMLGP